MRPKYKGNVTIKVDGKYKKIGLVAVWENEATETEAANVSGTFSVGQVEYSFRAWEPTKNED